MAFFSFCTTSRPLRWVMKVIFITPRSHSALRRLISPVSITSRGPGRIPHRAAKQPPWPKSRPSTGSNIGPLVPPLNTRITRRRCLLSEKSGIMSVDSTYDRSEEPFVRPRSVGIGSACQLYVADPLIGGKLARRKKRRTKTSRQRGTPSIPNQTISCPSPWPRPPRAVRRARRGPCR